jgi:hypothetical protein
LSEVNPLIEGSLIKQFTAQLGEQVQVVLKLFSRDQTTYNVTVQAPAISELLEEARPAEAQALPVSESGTSGSTPAGLALEMPNQMTVIKAWNLKGSRVHIEFAVLNDSDQLLAIRQIVMLVGRGEVPDTLQFKQFVDVKPEVRIPSELHRLPVVVPARSGLRLCAELETPIDVGFGQVDRECSLLVILGARNVGYRFIAQGNPVFSGLLEQIQAKAEEVKGAVALTLPTSSFISHRTS